MRVLAAAITLALLASCSGGPAPERASDRPSPRPRPDLSPTLKIRATPSPGLGGVRFAPSPQQPLPAGAEALAAEITTVFQHFRRDLGRWNLDGGDPRSLLARDVELQGLYIQRLMRALVGNRRLEKQVLARVPRALRSFVRSTVRAGNTLRVLLPPSKTVPKFRFARPASPKQLRRFYAEGERRFRIPWYVLASVNFVESKFGRVLGPSSAGALGPMQFLPSTWDAYGAGGNILDPHDSIIGAARYLSASGGPARMSDALFAYNRSDAYVDAILIYADQIRRSELNFYVYYFWQVFVITTKGPVQLTGPGAR